MGQARDEAGNIWETDAQGRAVRLVQRAGAERSLTVASSNPLRKREEDRKDEDQGFDRARVGFERDRLGFERDRMGRDEANREREAGQKAFSNKTDMRKEFASQPEVKAYKVSMQQLDQALRTGDGPQADLALTYAFAKAMDPESVVRDSEQQMQTNSQPWFQAAVEAAKKQFGMDGAGSFTPEARAALRDQLIKSVTSRRQIYQQTRGYYTDLANDAGFDPYQVVGNDTGQTYGERLKEYGGSAPLAAGLQAMPAANSSAGSDSAKQGGGSPSQYQNDPSGNRTFLTERDRAFAEEANAMIRTPGTTRADFDELAARYGAEPFGKDLDDALNSRAAGNPARILPTPTGFEEAGLAGTVLGPWAGGDVGSLAIGAGNAATFGQLGNLAEMTGSSEGGTKLALEMAQENALPYLAGEVIGSLAPTAGLRTGFNAIASRLPGYGAATLTAEGAMVPVRNVANLLANPITADVAYGAATGAAQAEDPLYGAVGGALLAGGGSYLGSKIGSGISRIGRPTGVDSLTPGQSAVLSAANRTGIDPVTEALMRADDLGVPLTLADVSPEVNSLTGAAIRRSPTVSAQAQSTLIPRGRGQYDRFVGAVERDLGPVENIPQRSEDLIAQASRDAGPRYDAAYAAPGAGAIHPQIEPLLNRPSMQRALARARTIAAEEGRDPTALGFDLDAEGNTILTRVPSWQTLDYAKRGIDDVLEGFRDSTTGRLRLDEHGRAIDSTRRQFLATVDAANPEYAAARATYAGPAAERDALQMGQQAASMSPDQLVVNMSRATPSQADQMRLGFQSQLAENGGKLRYSTNPFESVLGTPAMEQRLATLYPESGDSVARILAQSEMERQAAGSANRLIGNSLTAERGIADDAFMANPAIEATTDIVANALLGQVPITTAIKHGLGQRARDAVRLGLGRRATEKAEQIGPISLNPSPRDTIAEILAMQEQQAKLEAARAATGVTGHRYGGLVGTGAGVGAMPYLGGN